jgi:hypothetical protein
LSSLNWKHLEESAIDQFQGFYYVAINPKADQTLAEYQANGVAFTNLDKNNKSLVKVQMSCFLIFRALSAADSAAELLLQALAYPHNDLMQKDKHRVDIGGTMLEAIVAQCKKQFSDLLDKKSNKLLEYEDTRFSLSDFKDDNIRNVITLLFCTVSKPETFMWKICTSLSRYTADSARNEMNKQQSTINTKMVDCLVQLTGAKQRTPSQKISLAYTELKSYAVSCNEWTKIVTALEYVAGNTTADDFWTNLDTNSSSHPHAWMDCISIGFSRNFSCLKDAIAVIHEKLIKDDADDAENRGEQLCTSLMGYIKCFLLPRFYFGSRNWEDFLNNFKDTWFTNRYCAKLPLTSISAYYESHVLVGRIVSILIPWHQSSMNIAFGTQSSLCKRFFEAIEKLIVFDRKIAADASRYIDVSLPEFSTLLELNNSGHLYKEMKALQSLLQKQHKK